MATCAQRGAYSAETRSWRRRRERTQLRAACTDRQSRKLLTAEYSEREISMIRQTERGAETTQPNSPFTHYTRWTAIALRSLSFYSERCERLSCTRESRIKGEEKLVETSFFFFFMFQQKVWWQISRHRETLLPRNGGNGDLAPFPPVRGGKASTRFHPASR